MAANFNTGDLVFVPASKIPGLENHSSAFYQTRVVESAVQKIKVQVPRGDASEWIGSGLCHKNIGILIFTIGDLETETALLDPLAKSILQYCRLLVPDDYLRAYKIRSSKEFVSIWGKDQAAYSHIIFVGHGSQNGIKFGVDDWIDAEGIEKVLKIPGASKKVFISLCCKTGYASIAGELSKMSLCSHFIAPFHSVHGAVASQFAQTFFAYHLLQGESIGVAFKHARENIPGSTSFRLWQNGNLKAGPKS